MTPAHAPLSLWRRYTRTARSCPPGAPFGPLLAIRPKLHVGGLHGARAVPGPLPSEPCSPSSRLALQECASERHFGQLPREPPQRDDPADRETNARADQTQGKGIPCHVGTRRCLPETVSLPGRARARDGWPPRGAIRLRRVSANARRARQSIQHGDSNAARSRSGRRLRRARFRGRAPLEAPFPGACG